MADANKTSQSNYNGNFNISIELVPTELGTSSAFLYIKKEGILIEAIKLSINSLRKLMAAGLVTTPAVK